MVMTEIGPIGDKRVRRRQRYVDGELRWVVEERHNLDWSPKQIHDLLSADPRFRGRVPTLRTIQRLVADLPRKRDAPWRLEPPPEIDDGVVLNVLAYVTAESGGRKLTLSNEEASWLTAIHRARPSLGGPDVLFRLARHYISRRAQSADSHDLDAFLAYEPWADKWSSHAYLREILFGSIPASPRDIAYSYPRDPDSPPFVLAADPQSPLSELLVSPVSTEYGVVEKRTLPDGGIVVGGLEGWAGRLRYVRKLRDWAASQLMTSPEHPRPSEGLAGRYVAGHLLEVDSLPQVKSEWLALIAEALIAKDAEELSRLMKQLTDANDGISALVALAVIGVSNDEAALVMTAYESGGGPVEPEK
jgi:hypothetical protein